MLRWDFVTNLKNNTTYQKKALSNWEKILTHVWTFNLAAESLVLYIKTSVPYTGLQPHCTLQDLLD